MRPQDRKKPLREDFIKRRSLLHFDNFPIQSRNSAEDLFGQDVKALKALSHLSRT